MKKTLLASSLAVGLGIVAGNAGHEAHASEADLNKASLAQMAQSNDQTLNQKPIEAGAYNYTFDYEGFTYHFESDGTHFAWNYHATGANEAPTTNSVAPSTTQANQTQSQEVATPQNAQTQQPQAATSNNSQVTATPTESKASEGSSVNVNDHLKQIAQRESGGNIHAVNPSSGAAGKYQFLQSTWDSVAPAKYKGVSPANAPESVQDAAAVKLYNTGGAGHWVTA
ncbi:transglycosylase family protein [Staphylococcus schweitzeri]|uniref:transglycosylase family protein n=1 Tax=Staphylococcus schweitzeri TaxID=1654388 RepID=UPI000505B564|nr:transglycosylase family protein [Staphylococcus schweitzeri]CDR52459.1 SceD-like transglycosylase%2C biomarker for vancomycin-intermediate strains [Staphylococcus schweitzeri]